MRSHTILLALAAGLPTVAVAGLQPRSYLLQVELRPEQSRIEVVGQVAAVRDDLSAGTLTFRLHRSFDIGELLVNGHSASFSYREAAPAGERPAVREVVVTLPVQVREPYLRIELAYGGELVQPPAGEDKLDDALRPRRVELSWESAWYPQLAGLDATFSTDLVVAAPASWTVVATGEPQPRDDAAGRSRSRWLANATTDLVIVAAPDLKRVAVEAAGAAVEIYHTRLPQPFIDREVANARKTLELYQELLGAPSDLGATVRVVYSPRAAGHGGYARPPLIVLSEGLLLAALRQDPRLSLLRGTAHEAAHYWWSFGAGQGDWINEAFSEYFALLAVARLDSTAQHERTIAAYADRVSRLPATAPALAQVTASDLGDGVTIRYQKGALLLHAVTQAMGEQRFLGACRSFYEARRGQPTSTDQFRAFWAERLGDRAGLLELWLEGRGGAPVQPRAAP